MFFAMAGADCEQFFAADADDREIWDAMMKPSVIVDIDPTEHQKVYSEPDPSSASLGTLHGQTQGLSVFLISGEWAKIGAWNHGSPKNCKTHE